MLTYWCAKPPSAATMTSRARRSGATCWDPSGKLLGRIRLPEVIGNFTFGGPKRNRIFMAGSTSLYAVFVGVQGAAPS
jgi:gluconolactonase